MIILKAILLKIAKILTILLYLVTIVAAYSGMVNPLIWATPSILTLFFPYLAMASLVVAILWLCFRRFIIAGIGGGVLVLIAGPLGSVFPMNHSRKASEGATTFKVMTYNYIHGWDVNCDTVPKNGSRPINVLLESDADIICLQELWLFGRGEEMPGKTPELIDSIRKKYPYIYSKGNSDLTVLSKYPVTPGPMLHTTNKCNSQMFHIKLPGDVELALVNAHMTPYTLSEKERGVVTDIKSVTSAKASWGEFTGTIKDKLKEAFRLRARDAEIVRASINHIKGPIIVVGDFNDVPASWVYRTVKGDDLKDAYVETNFFPTNTYNKHGFFFHIDQVLYGGNLKAIDVVRGNQNSSDHYPVIAEFELLDPGSKPK